MLLCLVLVAGCTAGAPPRELADLTNPYLGVEYSQWLVGPIARLADAGEIDAYLALRDDARAAAFIEAFWARRGGEGSGLLPSARALFEERTEEADRRFSEAGYAGRRTDRGTIFVVYGQPRETSFEVADRREAPPIEVWIYGPDAPAGLDGRAPLERYRFAKSGDLTTFWSPLGQRRAPRLPRAGEPDSPPRSRR